MPKEYVAQLEEMLASQMEGLEGYMSACAISIRESSCCLEWSLDCVLKAGKERG